MELKAFEQQLEIQKMYRDDKFAGLLKQCANTLKEVRHAQEDLDVREKALMQREKMATVVMDSQETFNEQKEKAEAKNLADQQLNQKTKDATTADRKNVHADLKAAAEAKAEAELEREKAITLRKTAEAKNAKADAVLQKAEEMKAQRAARLEELGLKAA